MFQRTQKGFLGELRWRKEFRCRSERPNPQLALVRIWQGEASRETDIIDLLLDRAIDQFYTADVFMHTWDLARATGQDDRLDAAFCGQLLAGMEQFEEAMRSSGQYGARVEVPEDAGAQARLLGFIGRDPFWSPPRAVVAPR